MKLVFVSFDFPNNRCGPAVSFSRLLPVLKARGHEVHALVFADHRDVPSGILQDRGVVCRFFPWSATTRKKVKWILRWLITIKPDAFIPNSTVAGFYAARWARAAGIPTIGCYRANDEFHTRVVRDFVFGPAIWALSGLVCVSEKFANTMRSLGATPTQINVLPSGVPNPSTCCDQDDEIRIAYSGRLQQEQKRISETVDALISSIKVGLCSKVALFGDGPERGAIQSRIDSVGLGERIILGGQYLPVKFNKSYANTMSLLCFRIMKGFQVPLWTVWQVDLCRSPLK